MSNPNSIETVSKPLHGTESESKPWRLTADPIILIVIGYLICRWRYGDMINSFQVHIRKLEARIKELEGNDKDEPPTKGFSGTGKRSFRRKRYPY